MSSKSQSKEGQLLKIAEEIKACALCREGKTGLPVPGEGDAGADIFFVGEAPGKEEAKSGRPFIGRSGKFLRGTLREMGLREEEIFIASPVKYLPLKGTPSKAEIAHGTTHLLRQLAVIEPKVIVLMGNVAVWALLGLEGSVSQEHGNVVRKEGRTYLITFHPAAAMRFPKIRQAFLNDLTILKRLIKKPGLRFGV